jgi:multiple sugar transport system substrate-binding protein
MSTRSHLWRFLSISLIVMFALSACGTPGTPERVVETVVVERTVEVQVEQTVQVERTVQVEVTQVPGPDTGTPVEGQDGPVLNADVSGNIEMWHFWASPVRRNAIRRVIAICEQKLPNITITDTVKPFGDIWTANITAVSAGSGMPDVIVSDRPTLPRDAEAGVYTNLQEWADRDNIMRDQFYEWSWDQTLFEGNTYGIPHETDVTVLFWNKQLFEQAGLDPERPPQTWEEVEAFADQLDVQNANGTYSRIGFFPLWNRGVDVWQYTNDAEMIGPDGTVQINNPNMVETAEWIKRWVDRYGGWQNLQDYRNRFGAPPNDLFMSGGVAMLVDIFGYNSQLEFYRPTVALDNGETPRMDWGISLIPYNAGPGTWSGGFSMSIPTGSQNAEAAWEFIKCATSAEGQSSWARDTQAQPTNIMAAQDPVLAANPQWQVVDEALSTSTGGNALPGYQNWGEQLGPRLERIWLDELTPQEALDEAQEAVESAVQ